MTLARALYMPTVDSFANEYPLLNEDLAPCSSSMAYPCGLHVAYAPAPTSVFATNANSVGAVDLALLFLTGSVQTGILSGTLQGGATGLGLALFVPDVEGLLTGTLLGASDTYDRSTLPDEEHSTAPIWSGNPESTQGSALVDWNHAEHVELEIVPIVGGDRDLTRYKKAYSHTRAQPVRIRIIKR